MKRCQWFSSRAWLQDRLPGLIRFTDLKDGTLNSRAIPHVEVFVNYRHFSQEKYRLWR